MLSVLLSNAFKMPSIMSYLQKQSAKVPLSPAEEERRRSLLIDKRAALAFSRIDEDDSGGISQGELRDALALLKRPERVDGESSRERARKLLDVHELWSELNVDTIEK